MHADCQRSSKGRCRTNDGFGSVPGPGGFGSIIRSGPTFTSGAQVRERGGGVLAGAWTPRLRAPAKLGAELMMVSDRCRDQADPKQSLDLDRPLRLALRSLAMIKDDVVQLHAAPQSSSKARSRTNDGFGSVPGPGGSETIIRSGPTFTSGAQVLERDG